LCYDDDRRLISVASFLSWRTNDFVGTIRDLLHVGHQSTGHRLRWGIDFLLGGRCAMMMIAASFSVVERTNDLVGTIHDLIACMP
jgi:hypothetical protein